MVLVGLPLGGATCVPTGTESLDAGAEPAVEPAAEPAPIIDAGPPDEEGPVVTFTAPTDRCLSGVVTFAFTVVDEGVGTGFVSAQFAGVALDVQDLGDDVYQADVETTGLLVGLKDLVVNAVDVRNNVTEARYTYGVSDGETYLEHPDFTCGTPPDPPPDDEEPPTLTITSPIADFDVHESDGFTLTVTATDDVGPVTVVAEVGPNESALAPGGSDEFTGTVSLTGVPEGDATVVVTATDAAGRIDQVTRLITVDRTAPVVSITEPQEGATREWLNDVVATVTDNEGVERVTLFEQGVTEDLGSATAPQGGTTDQYGIIHDLDCDGLPRDLTFVVEARDRAGNVGQDTVGVTIRDNPQCN